MKKETYLTKKLKCDHCNHVDNYRIFLAIKSDSYSFRCKKCDDVSVVNEVLV